MKKTLFFLLRGPMLLTLVITLAACATSGNEDIVEAMPQQKTFDSFAEEYNKTMPTLFEIKAKKSSPRRAFSANGVQKDSLTTVYVLPDSSAINIKGKYTGTQLPITDPISLRDFVELADVNSWTFAMNNDGTAIDSVKMSEAEAREKLHPMVLESVKYLKSKGLTNAQIRDMLNSCYADSTQLVPLVLAMKTVEDEVAVHSNMQLAAPSTGKQQPTQSTNIDWEKVRGCAVEAIGLDIVTIIGSTSHVPWTYPLIIKAFKSIAKKVIGPISVLFVAAEFSFCIWRG